MTNGEIGDELSRAIEMYAAASDVAVAAAQTYNRAQIALDTAWRQKEEIRAALKPKE